MLFVLCLQMICKSCNHTRDVDLCRDSHLLSDGSQQYVDAKVVHVELVDISLMLKHCYRYLELSSSSAALVVHRSRV